MTIPDHGNVAAELYDALTPLAWRDEELGYHLLLYCEAIGSMLEQVDGYVRDNDALGLPGWGILLDVENVPEEALGYLAQFVGVSLVSGHTAAQSRVRIASTDGFARGSIVAFRAAAMAHLTGGQRVTLRERYDPANPGDDSPGHIHVTTYTDETPDSAAVLAALTAQKPAGLILHYEVQDGQDYQNLLDNHPTYQDVKDDYVDYDAVRGDY